jgi:hypothetical protein
MAWIAFLKGSEMEYISVFFLIFSILILVELVYFLFSIKNRFELRHCIRAENTREQFAFARNKLLKMAINKRINANELIFKDFYNLQTYIMRRPDLYPEISERLLIRIIQNLSKKDPRKNTKPYDINKYSDEMKSVVIETVKGVDLIIFDHSFWRRAIRFINKKYGNVTFLVQLLERIAEQEDKKSEINNLTKFRKDLNSCYQTV